MPTLAEENKKILRRSLDVLVGMDIPFVGISSVTATGNYSGSSEEVNGTMQEPILMDLSNGGFKNDGLAVPLGDDTDGFVSRIGQSLSLTVTLPEFNTDDTILIGYIGGVLHKWRFNVWGTTKTLIIPANSERIIVNRVICGEAFWFDNASLISCNLQLRSVDTKADNPELQMSEIEFEGYEPTDITETIGYIGTGYPIYYTSGYPGDMAPMRKFYLGEPIDFEDKIVKIKGYDATYKLDDEFGGVAVISTSAGFSDGPTAYVREIDKMLTDAGVVHTFEMYPYSYQYSDDDDVFIDKQSKRKVIANAVNFFRQSNGDFAYVINYVDAGIPRLWTGKDTSNPITLENISKPKIIVDPVIQSAAINAYYAEIKSASTAIETVDASGAAIYETSDPYYTFSANSGTITYLSPYSYKLNASGSVNVTGRLIACSASDSYLPYVMTSGTNGIYVDFGTTYLARVYNVVAMLNSIFRRSNISYEFEYRGDPNLQPRDYIRADIDGSGTLVDMTIDTIELKHEGGGTSSTIVARKGFI